MAESSPAPVGKSTARSGAIYTSADQLYQLIESEIAYAIKPYQDALDSLQRQLDARNAPSTASIDHQTASSIVAQSIEHADKELGALKSVLEESGLGVASVAGRPILSFIGESATIVSALEAELKRFSPNPDTVAPISPSSIVQVLVQGFSECKRRLDEAHRRYSNAFTERDDLKKTLVQREGTITAGTAERTRLETLVNEENAKVVALTKALGVLRSEAQTLALRIASARTESDEWMGKYHAVEAERDSLKVARDTSEGKLDTAQADVDMWKAKYLAAEADLKSVKAEGATIQASVDEWRIKHLAVATELKTTKDDGEAKLAALQSEVETLKARSLKADAGRDTAESALREANRRTEEVRAAALTGIAEWEAKGAAWDTERTAWDTERTRHKSQSARNAALITQLQAGVHQSETKLRDSETEQNTLKAALKDAETERGTLKASLNDAETERDYFLSKVRAAETERDQLKNGHRLELETWMAKSLTADMERDAAKSALTEHINTAKAELAEWTAKATAWDTERKRHKSQAARNAALITQLQADVSKSEAKLRDAETERDVLKIQLDIAETRGGDLEKKLRGTETERDNLRTHLQGVQTERDNLMTKLHSAETERDQLKDALQTENAQNLTKNNTLAAELELKKKHSAATTSPAKPPPSMFIKPRPTPVRPNLPDKPPSQGPSPPSPPNPASLNATPMARPPRSFSTSSATASSSSTTLDQPAQSPFGPVVGLQGRVSVRRNVASSPTTPFALRPAAAAEGSKAKAKSAAAQRRTTPRAQPTLTPNSSTAVLTPNSTGTPEDVLRAAPSLMRTRTMTRRDSAETLASSSTTTRASSKRAAERNNASSPTTTTSKRPALASQSNSASTQKQSVPSEASLKRPAPSPVAERAAKIPRVAETPVSLRSGSSFTRPPTVIPPPGQPQRVPAPAATPTLRSRVRISPVRSCGGDAPRVSLRP
ncbi:hypothetical protein B0H19DRAFT_125376 [Mycena capillaripes]|nr:hypothetical protein B0H19DRAFT_125376 [Mycena capillaripes]